MRTQNYLNNHTRMFTQTQTLTYSTHTYTTYKCKLTYTITHTLTHTQTHLNTCTQTNTTAHTWTTHARRLTQTNRHTYTNTRLQNNFPINLACTFTQSIFMIDFGKYYKLADSDSQIQLNFSVYCHRFLAETKIKEKNKKELKCIYFS